jgi:hypothetical protein
MLCVRESKCSKWTWSAVPPMITAGESNDFKAVARYEYSSSRIGSGVKYTARPFVLNTVCKITLANDCGMFPS